MKNELVSPFSFLLYAVIFAIIAFTSADDSGAFISVAIMLLVLSISRSCTQEKNPYSEKNVQSIESDIPIIGLLFGTTTVSAIALGAVLIYIQGPSVRLFLIECLIACVLCIVYFVCQFEFQNRRNR